jgi:transglutaminase-like putative cysteine protease
MSGVLLGALLAFPCAAVAQERSGEVELVVTIAAPDDSDDVRVWIPYPASNSEQSISRVATSGNFTQSGIYREKETGNLALYADWVIPAKKRTITLAFDVTARELVKKDFPAVEPALPDEIKEYLKSTVFIPTDGRIGEIAREISGDKQRISEKARAVYQWVVEKIITKRSGKCADISSVFVSLARAAGVPAREVFGLRLGKKDEEDMTDGHHCWVEFYVPGYGWVPADPADVRKIMLTDNLDIKGAQKIIDYYFGAVDEYRVVLARGGRGYYLNPRQKDGPLNYFMYPYAEVNGKSLEWLAAQTDLKYRIKFKAR